MKHFKLYKTLQLILYLVLTVVALLTVLTNAEIYRMVSNNTRITILCAILWLYFLLSYIFMFLDFTFHATFKKDYHDLGYAVHSDPLAGIANRYSCDSLIEKYKGKTLPSNLGCIMLELTNLDETNKLYDRAQGDILIKSFSNILKLSSVDLCFVGRNDGNKYLAIFENSSESHMDIFTERVESKIKQYNSDSSHHAIAYRLGSSFSGSDDAESINGLISLANARLSE
ncbi:MAG: GGDEF domain-containing protein [Lachnospiraceae bacterium]|nr:GGDEF domain-containing protein [Lachnospiraceae bacterium]